MAEPYSAPRPDEGSEPESCEPYRAQLLRVYMSGASEAVKPTHPETNPEYIRQAALDTLDQDANVLGAYLSGYFETPAFTVLHGTGSWRGTLEAARVIEVIHTGMSVKKDLALIREQALRLGYTVLVTVQDVVAAEVY